MVQIAPHSIASTGVGTGQILHCWSVPAADAVKSRYDPIGVNINPDAADRKGWKIEHIIETYLRAEFISGQAFDWQRWKLCNV